MWISITFIAAIAFVVLHWWLAVRRFRRVLTAMIVGEALLFGAVYFSAMPEINGPTSSNMSAGIVLAFATLVLAVPAAIGAISLWIYRQPSADQD